MKFINLTDRRLKILTPDTEQGALVLEPGFHPGEATGVTKREVPVDWCNGASVGVTIIKKPDLPEPQRGVIYVIDPDVERAWPRDDVYAPGKTLWNQHGLELGVNGLRQTWKEES